MWDSNPREGVILPPAEEPLVWCVDSNPREGVIPGVSPFKDSEVRDSNPVRG